MPCVVKHVVQANIVVRVWQVVGVKNLNKLGRSHVESAVVVVAIGRFRKLQKES